MNLKQKAAELVTPLAQRIAALDEKITAAGIAYSESVTGYEFAALLATENPTETNRADVDAAAAVREENRRELDKLQAARRQLETVAVSLKIEQDEADYERRKRALVNAGCHKLAVRIDELIESLHEAAMQLCDREQQAMNAAGELAPHLANANLYFSFIVNDKLSFYPGFGFKKLISGPNRKFQDFFTSEALLQAGNLNKPS